MMPFWDTPFDIQSNSAIIGFDSDQSFVGGGFTLVWNSHKILDYDFTHVFEAHEFVSIQAEYLFGSVMFGSDKGIKQSFVEQELTFFQTRKSTRKNSRAKSSRPRAAHSQTIRDQSATNAVNVPSRSSNPCQIVLSRRARLWSAKWTI